MTDLPQGEIVTPWQLSEIVRMIEQLATTTGYGSVEVVIVGGHIRLFRVTHSIDAVEKGNDEAK